MFKIIGVEILQPSARFVGRNVAVEGKPLVSPIDHDKELSTYMSIHKGLKPGSKYVFYQNYKIANGSVRYDADPIVDKLYGDKISVCAIVGENGSGKSTLIELIIRLLNNAAFALRKGLWQDGSDEENIIKYPQHFIPCVFVRLYFETDNGFMSITQQDRILTFQKQGTQPTDDFNWAFIYSGALELGEIEKKEARKHLLALFYSIVVNYAAYAYNIYDYRSEWIDPMERLAPQTRADDEQPNIEYWTDEDRCWIGTLFHKNDGYQLPIVLNPFRSRGNVNFNNERTLLNERLYELVRTIDTDTLEYVLQGKRPLHFVFDENREFNEYLYGYYNSDRVKSVVDCISPMQYAKVRPIEASQNMQRYANRILDAWDAATGLKMRELSFVDRSDYRRALNYVVYKTIKIALTYEDYREYRNVTIWNEQERINSLVADLHGKNNHITRKLRRTLAFLFYGHYHTSLGHGDKSHIVSIGRFRDEVKIHERAPKKGGIDWTDDDMMPAPCFHTDLWFKVKDGNEIQLSKFSSGEKQMIHLICTIIYHLINLHGNLKAENKAVYPYINLMIDEIELYFHPRYQTMLTKFLIDAIKKLNLDGFNGINIILATHSPYLLSDIPMNNVLKLENGAVCKDERVESFGANVYDLLNSHFFMKQYIGDFSASKINEWVRMVVEARELSGADRKSLRKSLELIGDNFIRNTLIEKLDCYDKD